MVFCFSRTVSASFCSAVDFAEEACAPSSQAGLITVYARYNGEPHALLGTAPIYDLEPGAEQTALFALIVPTLDIPIQIPVAVRTAGDYGLRFTVSQITQTTPLSAACSAGSIVSTTAMPSMTRPKAVY